jgi:uncharacterized membrane protein
MEAVKMKDKSLGIWLVVLFGGSGLAVISLGWLLPWLESDRIVATLGGMAGLIVAAIRLLMLRQPNNEKPVTVEIEIDSKP